MKEEYWFNPIFDECQNISEAAYYLEKLARAFNLTGNTIVCEELMELAKQLYEAEKKIRQQVSTHNAEDYKQSQEASMNMVKAALAVLVE